MEQRCERRPPTDHTKTAGQELIHAVSKRPQAVDLGKCPPSYHQKCPGCLSVQSRPYYVEISGGVLR